jgi:hypothetical protein
MRIHRHGTVVVAGMFLALGAAAAPLGGQEAAVVSGRVTNAQGAPEANATVTIAIPRSTLRATTNAAGEYAIRGVPAGDHRISVTGRGFAAQTRRLTVAGGVPARADFVVRRAAMREQAQEPAPQRQVREIGIAGEPEIRVASPRARQGFTEFWRSLSRAEAAALDRRLGELEARARRDGDVERDLALIRRQHPQLFQHAAALQGESWNLVGPGGVDEGSVECNGIGWIGMNGKIRCIGKLVVSD